MTTMIDSYAKSIIVAKTNNKRKTHCKYGHKLPKSRICTICKTERNKERYIKERLVKERLEHKKFKFFGVGNK